MKKSGCALKETTLANSVDDNLSHWTGSLDRQVRVKLINSRDEGEKYGGNSNNDGCIPYGVVF